MKLKKTLRIKYPECHVGLNPNYIISSNLLSIISHQNEKNEEMEIKIEFFKKS